MRRALIAKIKIAQKELGLDDGWTWNYAHGTAKKMFKVDRVEWLSDGNMHKLVAALQIAANRRKKGAV
ncbi:TPA: phage protein GemA/Gp16 family protein [Neisseria meningitidis]